METCSKHIELASCLAVLETKIDNVVCLLTDDRKRTVEHINEGERPGGVRERVSDHDHRIAELEKIIDRLLRNEWKRGMVSGAVGAVVAISVVSGSAELIRACISWVMK